MRCRYGRTRPRFGRRVPIACWAVSRSARASRSPQRASSRRAAASASVDHATACSQLPLRCFEPAEPHADRSVDEHAAAEHRPVAGVVLQPLDEISDAGAVVFDDRELTLNASHNRAAQRGQRSPSAATWGASRLARSMSPRSAATMAS